MKPSHLILVGLPGAGKTTVGGLLAEELGMPFVDVDTLIEERVGASAADIFAERGEVAFRELERQSVAELLARDTAHVIAPGGGWAAQPDNLRSVSGRALTVYLETTPAVAAARTEGTGHRPLLDTAAGERAARMGELYRQRERSYAGCDAAVMTDDRSPAEVALEVAKLARSKLG